MQMTYHTEVFFKKELLFAIWHKRNILSVSIQAGEASRTLHQICTRLVLDSMLWFQDTSTHIFYIVYHCSPCLVHQNSAYLRDANQLTETVSGGLTHCVRGQRSVVPWHDACTDRLKADAMPVACRSPALRFRLRGPHQAAIPSAIERTSPSDWVRTPGDGWNGTDSTCALHASHLG